MIGVSATETITALLALPRLVPRLEACGHGTGVVIGMKDDIAAARARRHDDTEAHHQDVILMTI